MKKVIVISLILLILVSGCAYKEKLPGLPTPGKASSKEFISGDKGITIEMLSPVDKSKVYTNIPFKIRVKVLNEGEASAEGAVCAFGLPQKYFPSISGCTCQSFTLNGRQVLAGEKTEAKEEAFELGTSNVNKEDMTNFILTTSTKYDYNTYAVIKACIKKDVSSEGCKLSPERNILEAVSSAPIQIVKATQDLIPTSEQDATLSLNIEIQNKGDGHLYDLDSSKEDCELKSKEDLEKNIEIDLVNAPGQSHCSPVRLEDKKGTAHCTVKGIKIRDYDYEPEITIKLKYAYETIKSTSFEVA